jgi:signal transduction histidine kinase
MVIRAEAERLLASTSPMERNGVKRLVAGAALVDELLQSAAEASRRPDGPGRWKWQEFDLGRLCREAVDAVRPIASAFGVRVDGEVSPDVGAVLGDVAAMRRLVMDLLIGACQREAATRLSLSVRSLAGRPRRFEVLVRDDAPGPDSRREDGPGRAGLWLCRTIATAHGGWIEARTSRDQGSVVAAVMRSDLPGPRPAAKPEEITVVDVDVIAEPPLVA